MIKRVVHTVLPLVAVAVFVCFPCLAGVGAEQEEGRGQSKISVKAGYDKNFYLATTDGRFRLNIYGYGQVRYTFQDNEAQGDASNLQVNRAKLGFRGHAFSPAVQYKLYMNIYTGLEESPALLDYFVDYTPLREFGVRVGQFKTPIGISYAFSAREMQFAERPYVDCVFRLGRDTGVNIHGAFWQGFLSYDLGIYNGEGMNRNNPGMDHLYIARLMVQPLGAYPFNESDVDFSPRPLMLAAASVAFNHDLEKHTLQELNGRIEELGTSDVLTCNAFLGIKYQGASLHAEYYGRRIDPHEAGPAESAQGFYVQAGYFVWSDRLEAAGRYEYFDPDTDAGGDLRQEYGAGLGWFIAGHRHKIQVDFFRINTQKGSKGSEDANRVRVQYHLAF